MQNITFFRHLKSFITIIVLLLFTIIYIINNSNEGVEVIKQEEHNSYAHITGAVKSPGVYSINKETRTFDLVKLAGGYTNANEDCVNPVAKVNDEDQVFIPNKKDSCHSNKAVSININLANEDDLQLLPGVGQATAKKIITYKKEHGSFKTPEEIKEVSGIGDSTYEKMKDYIVVD